MSNLIKSSHYVSLDDKKLIDVLRQTFSRVQTDPVLPDTDSSSDDEPDESVIRIKEQIIHDAQAVAEEQIQAAMDEANAIREQAKQEIAEWWEQRRLEDDSHIQQAKQAGYEEGFAEGSRQAELAVQEQCSSMLAESSQILEQSHSLKERIIQESEPFIIDLSCAIAQKIIDQQLSVSQEWVLQTIKKVLARRREKGIITLCVSPSQFSYIQDAREELSYSIDSQAELQILPDATVQDAGCVVRSDFGSIDARIDTQLTEIKNALRQIAIRNEGVQHDG